MPAVFYSSDRDRSSYMEGVTVVTNSGSSLSTRELGTRIQIPKGVHNIIITQAPDVYDNSKVYVKVFKNGKMKGINGHTDQIEVSRPTVYDKADLYLGKTHDKFFTEALDEDYSLRDLWYTKSLFG